MPIYTYKCDSCGFVKDVLQKISDPVLTECPSCAKATFAKQLAAPGFQLKGSGWYATDFKGSGSAGQAATASANTTSSDTPPATNKTETAAAASAACNSGCACHS